MADFTRSDCPRHAPLWASIAPTLPAGELAHDRLHIERVYRWSCRLAQACAESIDLAGAAALIHDAVFIPKNHPDSPLASEQAAQLAGNLLPDVGYDSTDIKAITEAIRTCSWSRGLTATSQLGVILQEADRLDALGAVGILRTAACHQHFASGYDHSFYHEDDPCAESTRRLNDKQFCIDHFLS